MSYDQLSLQEEAGCLLRELLADDSPDYGFGHMSPSVYDTAWVSMVSKDGSWLFPSTFRYLLDNQASSGGWESRNPVDAIIDTLAALLSLKVHAVDHEFGDVMRKAEAFLSSRLQAWDVLATNHAGFEITVPAMLNALVKYGTHFSFPGRSVLLKMNAETLSRIDREDIHNSATPWLRFLEGLVGHVDFDRLAYFKRGGAFMSSPSSTAAYLMNATIWDDECEAYLKETLHQCDKVYAVPAVPCVWPTTSLELSRAICVLHETGIDLRVSGTQNLRRIVEILRRGLEDEAKNFATLDDVVKVVTALRYLGHTAPIELLHSALEPDDHQAKESKHRVTTHCMVLSALLHIFEFPLEDNVHDRVKLYQSILDAVTAICETFWTTNGKMQTNWHASGLYPLLLIAQSLTSFLLMFDKGSFAEFPEIIVQTKAPITLFQILIRVLQAQNEDGSWGSCEETAYAMLALASLSTLPFISIMLPTIYSTLTLGRNSLVARWCSSQDTRDAVCLWTDKVNYRIPQVSYSYVLSALFATAGEAFGYPQDMTGELERLIFIPAQKVYKFVWIYRNMPVYQCCNDWQLLAYITEGYLYLPIVRDLTNRLWGNDGTGKADYIEAVPFTWTSGNAMTKKYSCPQNVFLCMMISLVNYEADQYLNSMIRHEGQDALPTLRKLLDDIFDALNQGQDIRVMDFGNRGHPVMEYYLRKYICYIVDYPAVDRTLSCDKIYYRRELKAYLLRMMQRTEHSGLHTVQDIYCDPGMSYVKWWRTLPAEHVSGITSCYLLVDCPSSGSNGFSTDLFARAKPSQPLDMLCSIWGELNGTDRGEGQKSVGS